MPQVNSYDPDVMVFKTGSVWRVLFGLLFLWIGILCLAQPFLSKKKITFSYVAGVALWGGLFTFGGMAIMSGSQILIDRRMQTVRKKKNIIFIFPFSTEMYALRNYDTVLLTQEERSGDPGTYYTSVVKLTGSDGELAIDENEDYLAQRRIAKSIAKFTGLKMTDSSTGQTTDVENLDEPLGKRIRRTDKISEIPPFPTPAKIHYTVEGKQFQIFLSGPPLRKILTILLGLVGGGSFSYLLIFFGLEVGGSFSLLLGRILAIVLGVLPILAFLLYVFREATVKFEILVSPEKLAVIEIWALGQKRREIPMADLQDLEMMRPSLYDGLDWKIEEDEPMFSSSGRDGYQFKFCKASPYIIARSDQMSLCFGWGLSKAEIKWLYAVIANIAAMSEPEMRKRDCKS